MIDKLMFLKSKIKIYNNDEKMMKSLKKTYWSKRPRGASSKWHIAATTFYGS